MKREQQWECTGCGAPERWFLHCVRHRGSYRRLCTNCLLKNRQGLFCPICLHVYAESPLPTHARLMCLHCPSITHRSCAPAGSASFTCPPCSTPNFSFFSPAHDNKKLKSAVQVHLSNGIVNGDVVIDNDSAKALVAAAKIAAASMARAASVARMEAERRVKEAALAKKRAKKALERVALLTAGERDSNKKPLALTPNGNTNNGNTILVKAKT